MKIILYQKSPDVHESLQDFLDIYFTKQMAYFASDLIDVGLSPTEIGDAVQKAMTAAKNAGLPVRQHFHLQYSDYQGSLIRDCKLSRLGYGLVLLNANIRKVNPAKWQVKVLNRFLSKN